MPIDAAKLKAELKTLIERHIDPEVNFEKQRQFLRLDKADKYYRGIQYIAPAEMPDGSWQFTSVGAPVTPAEGTGAGYGRYDYNINIIKTYGRRFIAVLGQRPFYHIKAVPDDPQSETDRKAARQAEIAKLWLHSSWDAEVKNLEIAHKEYKAGTVWIYNGFLTDAEQFGVTEEPIIEEREIEVMPAHYECFACGAEFAEPGTDAFGASVCPSCGTAVDANSMLPAQTVGVPEEVGTEEYPNGGVSFIPCDGFTVTVPFYSKDVKKLPYLIWEYEENKATLLNLYPELRKLIDEKNNFTSDEEISEAQTSAVNTRSAAESLVGTPRTSTENRWRHSFYWLNKDNYALIPDKEIRAQLEEDYPAGLKLVLVDGRLLEERMENEAAHEVWTACQPETSDFLYCDPFCYGFLGQQDATNDFWNLAIETLERGMPTHIVDAGLLDVDRLNEKPFLPQEIIETIGEVGASLDSRVKTLPSARFPDQLMPLVAALESSVQDQSGLQPRVWGGSTGTSTRMTAEQARLDLNQALMQLGTPGVFMTRAWTGATTNAVKQLEKYSARNMVVPIGKGGDAASAMLDFDALREGNWHFEGHPGIPQTFAERRDAMQELVHQAPELAARLGIDQPSNIGALKDYLGLPDLKVPGEDLRQKTLETIQELLQGEAVQEISPDGVPIWIPSIPPEEFVDDPMIVAQLVREWLVGAQGRKARTDNPTGYQNVKAFGMAQERLIPPPPGEMPPEAAPPEAAVEEAGAPPEALTPQHVMSPETITEAPSPAM